MGRTVQKFDLLSLSCTKSSSASSSPRSISDSSNSDSISSHCLNFRRRLSLKGILSRRFLRQRNPADDSSSDFSMKEGLLTGHKLKDLFVSSPPLICDDDESSINKFDGVDGFGSLRVDEYPVRRRRFGLMRLRYRLLRGAWRPRLVSIPE